MHFKTHPLTFGCTAAPRSGDQESIRALGRVSAALLLAFLFLLCSSAAGTASAADPVVFETTLPTPPPGDSVADDLYDPASADPAVADAPVHPTSKDLFIPQSEFRERANDAEAVGYEVELERQKLEIFDTTGRELIESLERTGPDSYRLVQASHGPHGNECSDPRVTYHSGYASAWGSAFDTRTAWYHNPAGFQAARNGDDMLWYSWAAREYPWRKISNLCNWYGNDPTLHGGSSPGVLVSNAYGGLTSESGYFYNPNYGSYPCDEWRPEYFPNRPGTGDGVSTVEGRRFSACSAGGYNTIHFYGSVFISPNVRVPRIYESDVIINTGGNFPSQNSDYLYYIFAHEAGHFWGAGHVVDGLSTAPSVTSYLTMGYNCAMFQTPFNGCGTGPYRPGMADGLYLGLGDVNLIADLYYRR